MHGVVERRHFNLARELAPDERRRLLGSREHGHVEQVAEVLGHVGTKDGRGREVFAHRRQLVHGGQQSRALDHALLVIDHVEVAVIGVEVEAAC